MGEWKGLLQKEERRKGMLAFWGIIDVVFLDTFSFNAMTIFILCCQLSHNLTKKTTLPKRQMQTHACLSKSHAVLAEQRFMYKQTRSIYTSDS